MFEHGIIEKSEFSVYFHPLENNTATLASPINGEITFGGGIYKIFDENDNVKFSFPLFLLFI
jgi:hypothetical protein